MQRYWLTGLIIIVAVFAATFLAISWRNDPNAEAGPAPIVNLIITDDAFAPDPIVIPVDRLVELRVQNDAARRQTITSNAEGIDQLPVETRLDDPHATGIAQPYLEVTASSGTTTPVLVRFGETGTYDLRVMVPGFDETARTLTVRVE